MNYASHATWDLRMHPIRPTYRTIGNSDGFLTFSCQHYPNLKFSSTRVCELRKAGGTIKQDALMVNDLGLVGLDVCRACPGPIDIATLETTKVHAERAGIVRRSPESLARSRKPRWPARGQTITLPCEKCGTLRVLSARHAYINGIYTPEGMPPRPKKPGTTNSCRKCSNGAVKAQAKSVEVRKGRKKALKKAGRVRKDSR